MSWSKIPEGRLVSWLEERYLQQRRRIVSVARPRQAPALEPQMVIAWRLGSIHTPRTSVTTPLLNMSVNPTQRGIQQTVFWEPITTGVYRCIRVRSSYVSPNSLRQRSHRLKTSPQPFNPRGQNLYSDNSTVYRHPELADSDSAARRHDSQVSHMLQARRVKGPRVDRGDG